jgi:hypothetical protein
MHFLDRVGLLPRGLRVSASQAANVIEAMVASGRRLGVHDVDEALAKTTLNSFGRMFTKARLGELGLL